MGLLATLVVLALAGQPEHGPDTRIRVTVPREIARAAKIKAVRDAGAPGPILILDGVEVGAGEGVTFSVLASSADPKQPPTVLAVTGVVGKSQDVPVPPMTKMQLVVPLNSDANQVVAEKTAITLTLRLEQPRRDPLRVGSAKFQTQADKR